MKKVYLFFVMLSGMGEPGYVTMHSFSSTISYVH